MSSTSSDPGETLASFAGRVSHDLKNPLASVRMSLELAREELGTDADPEVLALLERAERGVRRVDATLDELVRAARGEQTR